MDAPEPYELGFQVVDLHRGGLTDPEAARGLGALDHRRARVDLGAPCAADPLLGHRVPGRHVAALHREEWASRRARVLVRHEARLPNHLLAPVQGGLLALGLQPGEPDLEIGARATFGETDRVFALDLGDLTLDSHKGTHANSENGEVGTQTGRRGDCNGARPPDQALTEPGQPRWAGLGRVPGARVCTSSRS